MTSFYRNCEEIKLIANELLEFQLPDETSELKQQIIEKLLFGYHSHGYALSGEDLKNLGLKVSRDQRIEQWAWSLAKAWQPHIGGRNRTNENSSWNDAIIATSSSIRVRHRRVNAPAPSWQHFPSETGESQ
jgi:hypothetical protein